MASIVSTVLRFSRVTIENLYQINQNGLHRLPYVFSWQRKYFSTITEEKKSDDTNISSMQERIEKLKKLRIEFYLINIGLLQEPNDFNDTLENECEKASAEIERLKKEYPESDDIKISSMQEAIKNLKKLEIEFNLIGVELINRVVNDLNKYKDKLEDEYNGMLTEGDKH
ncbi:uncharacterized protein LOC105432921 [Pogonomyrmex barbatus]|uniref:Uncharacterized protein LOC105432921 n=1 Tax=Pogonomyrmex barbatus TaxID=144034 RepID=A0A6I9WQZ9_9HYME|nr:uncharacterized protein LOC105432921 [Pogonomyrmex barbatus]